MSEENDEYEYDEDDLYDENDETDQFLGEEYWEDREKMVLLLTSLKMNPEWYVIRLLHYNGPLLLEMEEWLKDNASGQYKKIGISSGCSSKVGYAFSDDTDAILFKLRFR